MIDTRDPAIFIAGCVPEANRVDRCKRPRNAILWISTSIDQSISGDQQSCDVPIFNAIVQICYGTGEIRLSALPFEAVGIVKE